MKATIDQVQAKAEQSAIEGTIEYELEQMSWQQVEAELFAILNAEDEEAALRAAGLHV